MAKKLHFVENLPYKKETMELLRKFKASKPWRSSLNQRMKKYVELHESLCKIYQRRTKLKFDPMLYLDIYNESGNKYVKSEDTIYYSVQLTTLDFLYHWGDVMYSNDPYQSFKWAVNLFRLVYPKEFAKINWITEESNNEKSSSTTNNQITIH